MNFTLIELVALLMGVAVCCTTLGMFIMAAMVVGGERHGEEDD